MYRFPLKDDELTKKWEDVIGKQNWKAKSFSRVCSDHFQASDYCHWNRMRLRKNSVPSIFEHNTEIKIQKRSAPEDFSLSPTKLKAVALEFHNYAKRFSEESTRSTAADSIVDAEMPISTKEEVTGIDIAITVPKGDF